MNAIEFLILLYSVFFIGVGIGYLLHYFVTKFDDIKD